MSIEFKQVADRFGVPRNVSISNTRTFYKTYFSGRVDDFNKDGKIKCNIELNQELASYLREQGFNVKDSKETEEYPSVPFLEVIFSYKSENPDYHTKAYVMDNTATPLLYNQAMLSELDNRRVESMDIVISPSKWEYLGRTGITAYASIVYIKLVPNADPFADKYATVNTDTYSNEYSPEYNPPINDDDAPF